MARCKKACKSASYAAAAKSSHTAAASLKPTTSPPPAMPEVRMLIQCSSRNVFGGSRSEMYPHISRSVMMALNVLSI